MKAKEKLQSKSSKTLPRRDDTSTALSLTTPVCRLMEDEFAVRPLSAADPLQPAS